MKKLSFLAFILTGFLITLTLSCKKDKKDETKHPACDWFPVMSGTSLVYDFTQHRDVIPPYVTMEKSYPTTDTSLSIYKLLFVYRDCNSGKVYFDHGPSDERIVLFDNHKLGTGVLITDTIFHSIRHFVTQTSAADGTLSITLKEEPSAHEELQASFKPGTGIVYVAAINPTNGEIIYTVELKQ